MNKLKKFVQDLENDEIDYFVALALGRSPGKFGNGKCAIDGKAFSPSTDWETGGPIIHSQENLAFDKREPKNYNTSNKTICRAWYTRNNGLGDYSDCLMYGSTYLKAVMRTIICGKFGKEVELP